MNMTQEKLLMLGTSYGSIAMIEYAKLKAYTRLLPIIFLPVSQKPNLSLMNIG